MKIAIIGGPGSGKSELAAGLQERLFDGKMQVIDDYVEKFCKRIDQLPGTPATYLPNLQIASHRLELERYAVKRKKHYIVCGTLIESIVYAAMNIEFIGSMPESDKNKMLLMREMYASTVLAFMITDTWEYDHTFLIPNEGSNMDDFILFALQQFNIHPIRLYRETMVEKALEAINAGTR